VAAPPLRRGLEGRGTGPRVRGRRQGRADGAGGAGRAGAGDVRVRHVAAAAPDAVPRLLPAVAAGERGAGGGVGWGGDRGGGVEVVLFECWEGQGQGFGVDGALFNGCIDIMFWVNVEG
jgi:hypothetical protein